MRRALVALLVATAAGSIALPVSASSPPTFKLVLTSAQTAVPVGGGPITFTVWNYGSESLSISVTTGATWATPAPTSFTVDGGAHQDVLVTVTPGAHGKTLVTFAAAAATVGTVRVIRALASPIWVGILPPRPKPATVTPTLPLLPVLGFLLSLAGLVTLARLIRRKSR